MRYSHIYPKKGYKDIYKVQHLITKLRNALIEIVEMVHFGVFYIGCKECFKNHRYSHLANLTLLLRICQRLQEPFSIEKLKDSEWHYQLYKDTQWAKKITVGQFIKQIVKIVCKNNTCPTHIGDLALKNEKLVSSVELMFRTHVGYLALLSVSSNYVPTGFNFSIDNSPFAMSTKVPMRILESVTSMIQNFWSEQCCDGDADCFCDDHF